MNYCIGGGFLFSSTLVCYLSLNGVIMQISVVMFS